MHTLAADAMGGLCVYTQRMTGMCQQYRSLLSGGIGLGVAFGLCALVNLLPMPPFFSGLLPTWETSLLSFGLLGLIALGSAMYPASRAAGIDPIEALRYEAGG